MAARTLAQALEGVHFPCDRTQLLDYARRNNLGEGALAALKEIPERNYRDMGEVFTALPARGPSARPRAEEPAEDAGDEAEASAEAETPPLPLVAEWWLNSWQQVMMPWEMTIHCLRGSAETWPVWLRATRHLWFPWSK